jgi:hypothetical protein
MLLRKAHTKLKFVEKHKENIMNEFKEWYDFVEHDRDGLINHE